MTIEFKALVQRLEKPDRQTQGWKKSALALLIFMLFLAEIGCTASARRAVKAVAG